MKKLSEDERETLSSGVILSAKIRENSIKANIKERQKRLFTTKWIFFSFFFLDLFKQQNLATDWVKQYSLIYWISDATIISINSDTILLIDIHPDTEMISLSGTFYRFCFF